MGVRLDAEAEGTKGAWRVCRINEGYAVRGRKGVGERWRRRRRVQCHSLIAPIEPPFHSHTHSLLLPVYPPPSPHKCPSYPEVFAVPATLEDEVVEQVIKFRAHGRLPVASYIHPVSRVRPFFCAKSVAPPTLGALVHVHAVCNNSSFPLSRSSSPKMPLLRGSQPTGNKCYEDVQLLRNVRDTCNCKKSYIIDTRPQPPTTPMRGTKVRKNVVQRGGTESKREPKGRG